MSKSQLSTYKTDIAKAIREAHLAIEEALECIRNNEDSSLTMRAALDEIRDRLATVETEVSCMAYSYENLSIVIARVNQQRDEAIRQRNAAIQQIQAIQRQEREYRRFC